MQTVLLLDIELWLYFLATCRIQSNQRSLWETENMFCLVVLMALQQPIGGKAKNCHDIALTQLSRLAELTTSTLHVLSVFIKALLKAPQPQLRIQVPMFCISYDRPTVTKKAKDTPEHTKMMESCRGIKYV